MDFFFHDSETFSLPKNGETSALTRFVARVGFIDDINAPATTNNLAVRVAIFERFE